MRLIDADELKADVVSWENCYNGFSDTYDKAMIIDTIDEQPTIDAEPVRRGLWIKTDKHDIYYQPGYKCSVCGTLTTHHGSYCPNCGAKMEGEPMIAIPIDKPERGEVIAFDGKRDPNEFI